MKNYKNTLIILVFIAITCFSCSGRKNKLDRSDLIPAKDLTKIITDIYITDGLITSPIVRQIYSPPDSLAAYVDVIESHGYTKEAMDKTIKFYSIKKPKTLIKIYDQALAKLSEMETRLAQEAAIYEARILNMWTGAEYYSYPNETGTDSTCFEIELPYTSIYNLSFTLTLFPDDQSVNPSLGVYTCHPDSLETGKRHYMNTMNYIKDGYPHKYTIILDISDQSRRLVRGCLLDCSNDARSKHYAIEKISITTTML